MNRFENGMPAVDSAVNNCAQLPAMAPIALTFPPPSSTAHHATNDAYTHSLRDASSDGEGKGLAQSAPPSNLLPAYDGRRPASPSTIMMGPGMQGADKALTQCAAPTHATATSKGDGSPYGDAAPTPATTGTGSPAMSCSALVPSTPSAAWGGGGGGAPPASEAPSSLLVVCAATGTAGARAGSEVGANSSSNTLTTPATAPPPAAAEAASIAAAPNSNSAATGPSKRQWELFNLPLAILSASNRLADGAQQNGEQHQNGSNAASAATTNSSAANTVVGFDDAFLEHCVMPPGRSAMCYAPRLEFTCHVPQELLHVTQGLMSYVKEFNIVGPNRIKTRPQICDHYYTHIRGAMCEHKAMPMVTVAPLTGLRGVICAPAAETETVLEAFKANIMKSINGADGHSKMHVPEMDDMGGGVAPLPPSVPARTQSTMADPMLPAEAYAYCERLAKAYAGSNKPLCPLGAACGHIHPFVVFAEEDAGGKKVRGTAEEEEASDNAVDANSDGQAANAQPLLLAGSLHPRIGYNQAHRRHADGAAMDAYPMLPPGLTFQVSLPNQSTTFMTAPSEAIFITKGSKAYYEAHTAMSNNGNSARDVDDDKAQDNTNGDSSALPSAPSASGSDSSPVGDTISKLARARPAALASAVPAALMQHCAHFTKNGVCCLGDECQFLHMDRFVMPAELTNNNSNSNNASSPAANGNSKGAGRNKGADGGEGMAGGKAAKKGPPSAAADGQQRKQQHQQAGGGRGMGMGNCTPPVATHHQQQQQHAAPGHMQQPPYNTNTPMTAAAAMMILNTTQQYIHNHQQQQQQLISNNVAFGGAPSPFMAMPASAGQGPLMGGPATTTASAPPTMMMQSNNSNHIINGGTPQMMMGGDAYYHNTNPSPSYSANMNAMNVNAAVATLPNIPQPLQQQQQHPAAGFNSSPYYYNTNNNTNNGNHLSTSNGNNNSNINGMAMMMLNAINNSNSALPLGGGPSNMQLPLMQNNTTTTNSNAMMSSGQQGMLMAMGSGSNGSPMYHHQQQQHQVPPFHNTTGNTNQLPNATGAAPMMMMGVNGQTMPTQQFQQPLMQQQFQQHQAMLPGCNAAMMGGGAMANANPQQIMLGQDLSFATQQRQPMQMQLQQQLHSNFNSNTNNSFVPPPPQQQQYTPQQYVVPHQQQQQQQPLMFGGGTNLPPLPCPPMFQQQQMYQ